MKYRVVIEGDYKMIRGVFEDAMEESEDFVLAASFASAEQAVEYCLANPVDFVILDVLFPGGMNGLEAAERLKRQKPGLKLLLVTSMPEASFLSRARQIGVDSFWYKETQEQSLLEIMQRTAAGESVYPLQTPKVQLGNILSDELTERELAVLRELVRGGFQPGDRGEAGDLGEDRENARHQHAAEDWLSQPPGAGAEGHPLRPGDHGLKRKRRRTRYAPGVIFCAEYRPLAVAKRKVNAYNIIWEIISIWRYSK